MARKPGEIFVMVSDMGACWGLGLLEEFVFPRAQACSFFPSPNL
jgi:hypothetical protein